MEVILLETIAKLGDLGDKVTVKSGYGRNFLIPQKKAVPATAENLQVLEGKLFGSITVRDISEAAEVKGVTLEKSEIRLPDGPIRELGEFEIDVHLHPEVDAILKLAVVPEA